MKKMLLVLSLIVVSSAYAATNQLIQATLTVVDPTTDVVLNVNTTAMQFGSVPIINGGDAESNAVNLSMTGNVAKTATITFPETATIKKRGGAETVDVKYEVSNPVNANATVATGTHTIVSTGNLGDGTVEKLPVSADVKATMALTGNEVAGVYEGSLTVSAAYN